MSAMHDRIAKDAGLPGVVHCTVCHRDVRVDPAASLASGWPRCCGFTMTIDTHEQRCGVEGDAP